MPACPKELRPFLNIYLLSSRRTEHCVSAAVFIIITIF